MRQQAGRECQLQGFFHGVRCPACVARLLQHAKAPVVSLHLLVGALAILPAQQDDHGVHRVCAPLRERFGQKGVGWIRRLVDETRAARVSPCLAEVSCKEALTLRVAWPTQLEGRGHGQQERQVLLVLLPAVCLLTDAERRMVPDKGGLCFLAHALAALSLLSDCLAGTTTALRAPCVALALEAVCDCLFPVQAQLVHGFDDGQDP